MNNKINNLEALLKEKASLKQRCKEKEQAIGQKLNYIQDNLGIIAFETILPINNAERSSIGHIFDGFHGILQTFIPSFSEKFSQSEKWIRIIELAVASIFTRFFNKKSE
jgi:hypothetical protein